MNQTVDEQLVETHEETKAGDAGNDAFKDVAHLIQHEITLQPVSHVTRRFVCTTLRHRTVLTELEHLFHRIMVAAGFGGISFVPLLLCQQILNGAVQ
ncbi:hypothetical protein D3C76_1502060 [compost metagenome]